jgi:hypothetical protein
MEVKLFVGILMPRAFASFIPLQDITTRKLYKMMRSIKEKFNG